MAVMFLLAGVMKLTKSQADLVASGQGWAGDVSPATVRIIGALEVLGAIGLVLPGLLDVATWVVAAAGIGLAVIMIGAVVTHSRRREYANTLVNVVLLALAIFVVVGRLGPEQF
nr:DoxX family protein [Aeromicrobium sp. CFBP 8757]